MTRSTRTLRRKLRRAACMAAQVMLAAELIAELIAEDYERGKADAPPDPARVAATRNAYRDAALDLAAATRGTARRRWLKAAEGASKGHWRPSRPVSLPPAE